MQKLLIVLLIGFVGVPTLAADEADTEVAKAETNAAAQSEAEEKKEESLHATYDKLLKAHVEDGVVDYKGLERDEEKLDQYLRMLAKTNPAGLSKNEQLALWINAYNAFTLKLILRYLPDIDSIKDIPGSKRWDSREWVVGGKKYSLSDIEHEILRKDFEEPRIHFAIVCASQSCPDLASEAYVGEKIDEQLDTATREFLTDASKGARTEREDGLLWGHYNTLYLSKIFSWFDEDFTKNGSVVDYVKPYLREKDRKFLNKHKGDITVSYLDYDWSLNDK